MTDSKLLFILSALMLLFGAGNSQALHRGDIPPGNTHLIHHNMFSSLFGKPAVLSLSFASSEPGVKVAGVYWLPDFLKNNLGRTTDADSENGIGGGGNKDPEYSCETYGYSTKCGPNEIWDSEPYPAGKICYKNCHCDDSIYKYDSSNCKASEGKQVSGKVCRGKSEACVCMPTVTLGKGEQCDLKCGNNCVKKSCKPADNPGTGEVCNERCASNNNICTRSDCKASVSVPSGYTCTEYCGSTCVGRDCVSTAGKRTCPCGGSGQVYSCGSYYYDSCYSCCTPSCSDDWGCSCGTYTVSDGCGGYCTKCSSCCSHRTHVSCSYGCASTCPCDNSCTSCVSGTAVKSCKTEFLGFGELGISSQVAGCQTNMSEYRITCGLKIRRTKTLYNGQKEVDEGVAWTIYGFPKTLDECHSTAASTRCYDDGFRWPYNC